MQRCNIRLSNYVSNTDTKSYSPLRRTSHPGAG